MHIEVQKQRKSQRFNVALVQGESHIVLSRDIRFKFAARQEAIERSDWFGCAVIDMTEGRVDPYVRIRT